MKRLFFLFACAFTACSLHAQEVAEHVYTAADSLRGGLTPFRTCYDVTYYDLTIKVDIENKSISGKNDIYFTAMNDFSALQIDLYDNLDIQKITWKGKTLTYDRKFNAVFVHFPEKIKKGSKEIISVNYSGKPIVAKNPPWDGGFTFTKDENKKDWVSVSCEGIGASVWWPNKDHLSDEPDSMMIRGICREDLSLAANGNMRKKYEAQNGYHEFDWFVSYPINNYDVSISIGDYVHFGDSYTSADGEKLAIDYYVLSYNVDKAKNHFAQVKPMIACYEKYLGKYPFYRDGYALIETPFVGMEHQSGIAYGNKYRNGYSGVDYSRIGLKFDYIIIHESGHEWWGNSITCSDLADMWINEGFCTYSESAYVECMYGIDTAMLYLNAMKAYISNDAPVIGDYGVNNEGSGDMYHKGALFLNTLRTIVNNDQLWWDVIKGLQKDFAYKTVSTDQFEQYMSKKSGLDLANYFNQYLRYKNPPILHYSVKQNGSDLQVTYRWITDVKNFSMPIRYAAAGGDWKWTTGTNADQTITLKNTTASDFSFDDTHFYYIDEKEK